MKAKAVQEVVYCRSLLHVCLVKLLGTQLQNRTDKLWTCRAPLHSFHDLYPSFYDGMASQSKTTFLPWALVKWPIMPLCCFLAAQEGCSPALSPDF